MIRFLCQQKQTFNKLDVRGEDDDSHQNEAGEMLNSADRRREASKYEGEIARY